MSDSFEAWLATRARERRARGLDRTLRPRRSHSEVIDLAGNDYLGLARDHRVVDGALAAIRTWGAGSTGSRLVTGTTQAHADLEADLAAFLDAEDCLVFASGYAANLAAVTALGGPDTLVVSDEWNHASLIDGCRLSRSRVVVVPHGDITAVDDALASRPERRAIVACDAVFSADGSVAPLVDLHAVVAARDAILLVDEAHALGVVGPGGRGGCAEAGIARLPNLVRTVTLSKALGSQGGAVVATGQVVDHLVNAARTFIFDTGLAPGCVGAAHAALEILGKEPELPARVRDNAATLADLVGAAAPASAIVPLVLGEPARAVRCAAELRDRGIAVGCFRPPSVPSGSSMLRMTARADLTANEIAAAAAQVVDVVERTR
jgi:8-amino-7-oxononanoate synthase